MGVKARLLRAVLAVAACAGALGVIRSAYAASTAGPPSASPQTALAELATQARPGILGITVIDLETGRSWRVNAERAYPMMSVFKAPLGATVLALAAAGKLSLDRTVIVRRADLVTGGVSQIAATFHGDRETFTVRQLLAVAVSHSDNTAADVLLELVGGPQVVTAFLRAHGILGMRVDRGEEEIARELEQGSAAHAIGRRGYEAYLKDPRDRTTPDAAALFLRKLWRGELLSGAAKRQLLSLLYAQTIPDRLRAGVPAEVRLADKCGTSASVDHMTAAFNDIGILTWPDGHTVIVAAFLTASPLPSSRMNALFETIARTVAADVHPGAPPAG